MNQIYTKLKRLKSFQRSKLLFLSYFIYIQAFSKTSCICSSLLNRVLETVDSEILTIKCNNS